jgi:hypothetical protein
MQWIKRRLERRSSSLMAIFAWKWFYLDKNRMANISVYTSLVQFFFFFCIRSLIVICITTVGRHWDPVILTSTRIGSPGCRGWYAEHNLTILSHVVLTMFARTSREIFWSLLPFLQTTSSQSSDINWLVFCTDGWNSQKLLCSNQLLT